MNVSVNFDNQFIFIAKKIGYKKPLITFNFKNDWMLSGEFEIQITSIPQFTPKNLF